ncbi:MAG: Flp family type IVb pilin [Bryobacteraceae bacterium]
MHDRAVLDRRVRVRSIRRLWKDCGGQDMIEYSLLAASLVVVVAGFLPPTIMPSVSKIFSTVASMINAS